MLNRLIRRVVWTLPPDHHNLPEASLEMVDVATTVVDRHQLPEGALAGVDSPADEYVHLVYADPRTGARRVEYVAADRPAVIRHRLAETTELPVLTSPAGTVSLPVAAAGRVDETTALSAARRSAEDDDGGIGPVDWPLGYLSARTVAGLADRNHLTVPADGTIAYGPVFRRFAVAAAVAPAALFIAYLFQLVFGTQPGSLAGLVGALSGPYMLAAYLGLAGFCAAVLAENEVARRRGTTRSEVETRLRRANERWPADRRGRIQRLVRVTGIVLRLGAGLTLAPLVIVVAALAAGGITAVAATWLALTAAGFLAVTAGCYLAAGLLYRVWSGDAELPFRSLLRYASRGDLDPFVQPEDGVESDSESGGGDGSDSESGGGDGSDSESGGGFDWAPEAADERDE